MTGAVAIGNFDGVHRGHQAVIARVMTHAGAEPTVVLTFEPHPRTFFRPAGAPRSALQARLDGAERRRAAPGQRLGCVARATPLMNR